MANLFDLTGRVAVVTGGAGGIGSAIAKGLAGQGASVVVTSRGLAGLEETAHEITEATGATAVPMTVDVSDEKSVATLVAAVLDRFGKVDILVNAHGFNFKAQALELSIEQWKKLMDVNVTGTIITCQQFGRVMVAQKRGKIINLSSVRGVRANAGGNTAYCASKAAVDMITRCMATEWAPHGVNVNAIGPALIATKLTEKQMQEPGRVEKYLRNIPWGRLGRPEDCVGAAIYLASDASDYITGQILYVDGGLTAIG